MSVSSHSGQLVRYVAPAWCAALNNLPETRIQLGVHQTPIHRWRCPRLPEDIQLWIKRDDMTGSTLSGNKVRKLEFILAEAVSRGCRHVITCGGVQSNFCRAVAVSARQVGLTPHLVLRSRQNDAGNVGCSGNLFLDRLMGSNIHLVPPHARETEHLIPMMEKLAQQIESDRGETSHVIRVGGSDLTGVHGYLSAFHELLKQNVADGFDDVIVAVGSGGTAAGLAIGNYLAKTDLRIHAVCVCDDAEYFYRHVQASLDGLGLGGVDAESIIDIVDGYKGRGYGLSTQDEMDFLVDVARSTGIVLDPVYTVKAVLGLVGEVKVRPHRFKGKRILFIHTGGIFGAMDGRLEETLTSDDSYQVTGYDSDR